MKEINLNINGRDVKGAEGQTILNIARENNIDIPTLCQDDRVEIRGSCGLCLVEIEGNPRLIRSCAMPAENGMVIKTETDKIRENRRIALELLISDHTGDCRPPCTLACPAQTDCQGYVKLIANGEYAEALKVIRDKIPLPASIGRICPHPCEDACRRELVEEPVSIAALKQFVGDLDIARGIYINENETGTPTNKNIAVIGGGPGGLTAAYFLRMKGHGVTVYDAMPQMGGMLQYGVPEYRLPKKILQKEIDVIEKMNVKFINNITVGRDITLDYLRNNYDAVIVAAGAWKSLKLGCPGEELNGVIGAIDFLKDIHNYKLTDIINKKIAVVGGSDVAMDACRTAVRLGAGEVYNIYRRTKNEMPANKIEITEAEEEGVIFKNLKNPIEIIGGDGKVKAVRLQIMELGESDDSGRLSPVPVQGKEEIIEVDYVIIAIGQKLNNSGFEELELTKHGTIIADEHTFCTNLDGVFAIGDASNKGADIAITAIGEAKKAVDMVDKYLNGENLRNLKYEELYYVKSEKTADDFTDKEKRPRNNMLCRTADDRVKNFEEIKYGLREDEAKKEAARCLECGCQALTKCKLINYANIYKAQTDKYSGEINHYVQENINNIIHNNPDKCVLCGLCVLICREEAGASILGFVNRGFDTLIKPALYGECDIDCGSCGKCVEVCPTGAMYKNV